MAKHAPAPPGHKELRAVWLSPRERADIQRAAEKRSWSLAKYAEKAILEKAARDLAPPVPNLDELMDKMHDLPAETQAKVIDVLADLLRPHRAQPKP